MTHQKWTQIESILDRLLDLPEEERLKQLEKVCSGDLNLMKQVEDVLSAMKQAGDFLETPLTLDSEDMLDSISPPAPERGLKPGTKVGVYEIVRQIGRGGMGSVYLAERADKQFKKVVAIKVVRQGMDTEDILKRFHNERQILASLNHPNIAKLLDGGVTPDGYPYFVMEYISGIPLDVYCDRNKLTILERLQLFRVVCEAIHHAHQNLVVHRDLKPSNILITGEGQVKLLDFGVAKVLNPEISALNAIHTRSDTRILTPEYASPEQVRGEQITTASDVYSLGVVLYELLTGHRPYRLAGVIQKEIERVILEEEPTRPSTVITQVEQTKREDGTTESVSPEQISKARNTNTDRLRRRLRGDLDNIILMAMRKEPKRRYSSAENLSEDIQRHLQEQPVVARKDTPGYRLQKFVKRHTVGVAAAFLVIVSMVTGLYISIWQAQIAAEERNTAEQISEFMVNIFEVSDPSETRGDLLTAHEILDQGAERLDEELADQPEIKAKMLDVIGRVYRSLGSYQRAQPLLLEALSIRREHNGDEHEEVASSLNNLATLYQDMGNYHEASRHYNEALAIRKLLLGDEHPEIAAILNSLAEQQWYLGNLNAADSLFRQTLDMQLKLLGNDHPDVAQTLNDLGYVLYAKGELDVAEPMLRQALEVATQTQGNIHPQVATVLVNLANLLETKRDLPAAERYLRDALRIDQTLHPDGHPDVAITLLNLGRVLTAQGDHETAESMYLEALDVQKQYLGEEHPSVAQTMGSLAQLEETKGNFEVAEDYYNQSLYIYEKLLGEDHLYVAITLNKLARLERNMHSYDLAQQHFTRALNIYRDTLPAGHLRIGTALLGYGQLLFMQNRFREAEVSLIEGYEILSETSDGENEISSQALQLIISLYDAWDKPDQAAQYRSLMD